MWSKVFQGLLKTGTAPAKQFNIDDYTMETKPEDNTIFYIAIIAALLIAAGTVYFITKK
jgi:hypothetical protein